MNIIRIDESNIAAEHICCALGSDKVNQARSLTKKAWMREQFQQGLVFKRLDQRGKVFIEYMPIEKSWKPILGKNFMVIHCLWVSGRFKGQGISSQLLNECIADAKSLKMEGIVVVTSNKTKPFLTDKEFFEHHGFSTIDTAPPYFELMALKFRKDAKDPAFTEHAKKGTSPFTKGLAFIYSHQCPFMEEYVSLLASRAKRRGIPCEVHRILSARDARQSGSPFGTLGIYYKGAFQTHELMPEGKFDKFLDTIER